MLFALLGACAEEPPVPDAAAARPDGAGQLWVPEGPPEYHPCVEPVRGLLGSRTSDQRRAFESCVNWSLEVAHASCKGEQARYGDTLRPVRFGDLGGCVKSWTVGQSRRCCEAAIACTAPSPKASP